MAPRHGRLRRSSPCTSSALATPSRQHQGRILIGKQQPGAGAIALGADGPQTGEERPPSTQTYWKPWRASSVIASWYGSYRVSLSP